MTLNVNNFFLRGCPLSFLSILPHIIDVELAEKEITKGRFNIVVVVLALKWLVKLWLKWSFWLYLA